MGRFELVYHDATTKGSTAGVVKTRNSDKSYSLKRRESQDSISEVEIEDESIAGSKSESGDPDGTSRPPTIESGDSPTHKVTSNLAETVISEEPSREEQYKSVGKLSDLSRESKSKSDLSRESKSKSGTTIEKSGGSTTTYSAYSSSKSSDSLSNSARKSVS